MAKGNTSSFGGINIIFTGDFTQSLPGGQTHLYDHINMAMKYGQNTIFRKLLCLSVKTVVILTEIKQQTGENNASFVSLLSQLQDGKCMDKDYELLSLRVISNIKLDWSDPEWSGIPVIVSDNMVKDVINEKSAAEFAQQSGQELQWYYATDLYKGKSLGDTNLKQKLETLHSGLTSQWLGNVPLVLGMPMMISTNFNVEGGIVNGCTGILKQIRYHVDSEGKCHSTSCVIHTPNTTGENLPHLHEYHVAALEDSVEMTFTHPHFKQKCKITCIQVPIASIFTMTANKVQG